MELSLKPGNYINQVGKHSKRYFTFKLIQCLVINETHKYGIWRSEKYVPDMYFYESYHEFNADFLKNSSQCRYRKTRLCEIFDFEVNKINKVMLEIIGIS